MASYLIPKAGALSLEDGDLVVRRNGGKIVGRLYCSTLGLTYDGDLTLAQRDGGVLRLVGQIKRNQDALGTIAFGTMTPDDTIIVGAALAVTIPDDLDWKDPLRGQVALSILSGDPPAFHLAQIWTDAWTLADAGRRVLRSYARRFWPNLWKWEDWPPDPKHPKKATIQ